MNAKLITRNLRHPWRRNVRRDIVVRAGCATLSQIAAQRGRVLIWGARPRYFNFEG